jgi:hypothetical protein
MIGAQPGFRPAQAAPKKNPMADLSGLRQPRKISDGTTEDAANNANAAGFQQGYRTVGPQQGFSKGAHERMAQAQAQAAGQAQGAQQAAGIRAEDQMFNAQQDAGYQALVGARLNSNYELQTGLNSANWQKQFAQQSNRLGMGMARQGAWQQIRLALLSQME